MGFMIDPDRFDPAAYVAATAPVMGLVLDAERTASIAAALALVARIGAPALACAVPAETEPAPVFTP
jgi:hypothetical protein